MHEETGRKVKRDPSRPDECQAVNLRKVKEAKERYETHQVERLRGLQLPWLGVACWEACH